MNLLQQQQQRIMQIKQQQQQQQILKSLPQQRLQQQQQLQQQALSLRSQVKPSAYEPGTCARRLTHYMFYQKHRPSDNNIEFWRKFVAEYFAPHARKRWCVSLYGTGRQTTGVFPQDVWHCEICNCKPGRGFETTVEVLPRLYKIKYDSGTQEELLYVDMPREYQNASGQIVLDYAKAIQESVFEQLRVVRDGQLRIVFSSDLKICSWEFCARRHEELIPRRLIIPQVSQLGQVVQKYQAATQNGVSSLSAQEVQNSCNLFVASTRQLAKALEVPLVNDLGYTKRYVRCLQIAEVVNCMKDLIDCSRETGTGPMESLVNFPRRTSSSSGITSMPNPQADEQQPGPPNSNLDDQNPARPGQLASGNNSVVSVNHPLNPSSSSSSATAIASLQNSINARPENTMSSVTSSYPAVQIPSASSSSNLPPSQPNPPSPFPSPTPSASATNGPPPSHMSTSCLPTSAATMPQPAGPANDLDPVAGSQSSVQQILQEMMMSSQLSSVGALGGDMKVPNGIALGLGGMVGNGVVNPPGVGGSGGSGGGGYGTMGGGGIGGGIGPSVAAGGIRAAMANNSLSFNGRVGMSSLGPDPAAVSHQQQELGSRLLSGGLGAAGNFNNLQFAWKTSP
ncbi:unnamed protein product [Spirodela intermedia]|nr:unnamed protein product [Spirodela intermedia]CAA6668445.1 unnamed protein product [Spirodela intermedia]